MYIGVGTLVVILIIVLIFYVLRHAWSARRSAGVGIPPGKLARPCASWTGAFEVAERAGSRWHRLRTCRYGSSSPR